MEIVYFFEDAKVGERIFLEGQEEKFPQAFQPVLNPKKKILEGVLPGLKTDDLCFATFNGNEKKKRIKGKMICFVF